MVSIRQGQGPVHQMLRCCIGAEGRPGGAGWGKGGPTDPARGWKGRYHKMFARLGEKGKNGAKIKNQESRKHRKGRLVRRVDQSGVVQEKTVRGMGS